MFDDAPTMYGYFLYTRFSFVHTFVLSTDFNFSVATWPNPADWMDV